MNRTSPIVASLALAFICAACDTSTGSSGGSSSTTSGDAISGSDTGGGTGGSLTIDQFPKALADAACAAIAKCPEMQETLPLATPQGCLSMYSSVLSSMDPIVADVQAGKTKYDAAAAGNCLAMLKGDCAAFKKNSMADTGPCKAVFVGLLPDAKDCVRDEQCASGWCAKLDSACSTGACKAPVAAGAACADTDRCAGELQCLEKKCQVDTPAKVGESCDGGRTCVDGTYCNWGGDKPTCSPKLPVGAECNSSGDCLAPARCIPASAGKSVCAAPAVEGAAIKPSAAPSDSGCAAGLVCISDSILNPGKCQKKVAVGGACTTSVQCGAWDLGCIGAGSKVCGALPNKGESCQPGDMMKGEYFSCLVPYSCVDGKCVDPPKAGEKCGNGIFRCQDGLHCDDKSNTCQDKPGLGQPCSGDCGPDLTCGFENDKSVCVAATCK